MFTSEHGIASTISNKASARKLVIAETLNNWYLVLSQTPGITKFPTKKL